MPIRVTDPFDKYCMSNKFVSKRYVNSNSLEVVDGAGRRQRERERKKIRKSCSQMVLLLAAKWKVFCDGARERELKG